MSNRKYDSVMYIVKLIEPENIKAIIPLLNKLDSNIEHTFLEARLEEMLKSNYECIVVYNETKLIGISGLWFLTKYYAGKHIELDNVYILPEYQEKGLGKLLVNWILDYGKSKGCITSKLNCYVDNFKGHKFWNAKGYENMAYYFAR